MAGALAALVLKDAIAIAHAEENCTLHKFMLSTHRIYKQSALPCAAQ